MKTLVLSAEDLRRIVERVGLDMLMDETIRRLEAAFRDYDAERIVTPTRDGFHYHDADTGLLEWMPAMEAGNRATIKVVGYHPSNPQVRQLPTILATLFAFDSGSGHFRGVVDGTFLTAIRTGAASAVASRILASPESRTLGLIGCGAQAVTQLHALSQVFPLDTALIYDRDADVMRSFAGRASFITRGRLSVVECPLERLVAESDIITTATSVEIGGGPVFEAVNCRPWLHVNAVGSDVPGKTELPDDLLERSLVCPDFLNQALKEGECQRLSPEEIGPSIVELVKDSERYVSAREATSVFDSTGWALEDHVALEMVLGYAEELGLGTDVEIEGTAEDARDPYSFLRTLPAELRAAIPHSGRGRSSS